MKNNLQVRMQMVEGDPMLCLGGAWFQRFFFARQMAQRLLSPRITMLVTKLIFLGLFSFPWFLKKRKGVDICLPLVGLAGHTVFIQWNDRVSPGVEWGFLERAGMVSELFPSSIIGMWVELLDLSWLALLMEEHQFHGKFDKNRGAIFLQQYICPVFFWTCLANFILSASCGMGFTRMISQISKR